MAKQANKNEDEQTAFKVVRRFNVVDVFLFPNKPWLSVIKDMAKQATKIKEEKNAFKKVRRFDVVHVFLFQN